MINFMMGTVAGAVLEMVCILFMIGWRCRVLDWEKAQEHLYYIADLYESIGWTGTFALVATINPLVKRFENGERTEKLYNEIMDLE